MPFRVVVRLRDAAGSPVGASEGTDLSFEYSSGKAKVLDEIESVKNPTDLVLIAKGVKEMILDENREEGAKLRYTTDLTKGFDDEF